MRKKVIAGVVVALMLALALPIAFAADANNNPSPKQRQHINFDRSQLDDNELQQLNALRDQMLTLRKQMIGKYAEFGAISQADADALIARIDARAKLKNEKGFHPGFGHGKMKGMKGGFRGRASNPAPTS